MAKPKQQERDPLCHSCSQGGAEIEMDLVFQCQVEGFPTFRFSCPKCTGVVNLQRNGRMVRQIILNGSAIEYKPWESWKLGDQTIDLRGEIKETFSLGAGMTPEHRAQYYRAAQDFNRVMAGRVRPPQGQTNQQAAFNQAQAQYRAAAEAQARYYQAQVAQTGYTPVRMHQQPVAYTLGNGPQAIHQDPNELRRRILGLPPQRRR